MKTVSKLLRDSRGFTMLELMLVLIVGAALVGGALYAYSRVETTQWINKNTDNIIQAAMIVENVKGMRNGILPAQAGDISLNDANSPFKNYIGSTTADLSELKYRCTAGTPGSVVITFETTTAPNTDAINGLQATVASKLTSPKYTVGAVTGGNKFSVTIPVPSCA